VQEEDRLPLPRLEHVDQPAPGLAPRPADLQEALRGQLAADLGEGLQNGAWGAESIGSGDKRPSFCHRLSTDSETTGL